MQSFITELSDTITTYPFVKTLIYTVGLFIFFGISKRFANSAINRKKLPKAERIQLHKKASRYVLYILVICTFILWFSQLQVFFVSLFAVAAAIVLAFKELIMCLTGGVLVNISKNFANGQRIEVDGNRGFVIEKSLLTTKILEIGPEKNSQQTTGDIIAIPNSLMLSKSLKNESYFKGYSIKSFIFKIENIQFISDFENSILKLANDYCAEYLEQAKKHISQFCEKEGVIVPSIDPRTKIILEDGAEFSILLKMPVHNADIANIEQKINRFYLDWNLNKIANKEVSDISPS